MTRFANTKPASPEERFLDSGLTSIESPRMSLTTCAHNSFIFTEVYSKNETLVTASHSLYSLFPLIHIHWWAMGVGTLFIQRTKYPLPQTRERLVFSLGAILRGAGTET